MGGKRDMEGKTRPRGDRTRPVLIGHWPSLDEDKGVLVKGSPNPGESCGEPVDESTRPPPAGLTSPGGQGSLSGEMMTAQRAGEWVAIPSASSSRFSPTTAFGCGGWSPSLEDWTPASKALTHLQGSRVNTGTTCPKRETPSPVCHSPQPQRRQFANATGSGFRSPGFRAESQRITLPQRRSCPRDRDVWGYFYSNGPIVLC